MEAELMWSWHSDFETAIRQTLDVMVELGVVVEEDELVKIPPPTSDAAANLTDLAEVVEPMLERFHIVTTLLKHNPTDSREFGIYGVGHRPTALDHLWPKRTRVLRQKTL